jgi:hypothetical protein
MNELIPMEVTLNKNKSMGKNTDGRRMAKE